MNTTTFNEQSSPKPSVPVRVRFFKWFRVLLGVSLVGTASWWLWQRQARVVSRVGYINGEIIHIYAPITGNLQLAAVQPGQVLPEGALIGRMDNERNAQLEIDLQNLRSRLRLARSQLSTLNNRIANRTAMYNALASKADRQMKLDIEFFRANVDRSRSELQQAQAQLQLAQQEAQRFTTLAREGAVPQQRADQAIAEWRVAQKLVEMRQAELQRTLTSLRATRAGLQIDSARTFSFPEIRLLDLTREINDLEMEKRNIEVSILTLQQEIARAEQQLRLERSAVIKSPTEATVWSVNLRTGTLGTPIGAGTPIMQLLNCRDIWATGLVAEHENQRLHLGQRAEVRLLDGTNRIFQGRIRAIRGGTGRVTAGADVAIPPSELVRNELEVQVQLDDLGAELANGQFCGVGISAEITFPNGGE